MNKVNGKLSDRQKRQAGFLADWEVGFSSNMGRDHVLSVEAKDLRLVLNDLENPRPRIEHHASRKDQTYFEEELYTTTNCTWVWPIHVAVSEVEPVQETPNTIYSGFTGIIDSPFPSGFSQSGVGGFREGDSLIEDNPIRSNTGYGSMTAFTRSVDLAAKMNHKSESRAVAETQQSRLKTGQQKLLPHCRFETFSFLCIHRLYGALANIPLSRGVRLRLDGRSWRQNKTNLPLDMDTRFICKYSPSKPSATGAPEGYGRRWTASLDFEGQELDLFGDFVQQHGHFWTSIRPTLDRHLHQLANEIEAFFLRMNGDLTNPRHYKDWARIAVIAFDSRAVKWKENMEQVNSSLSRKQVDSHFLPEVSFGFAPDKGKLYTIHIEIVDLQSHWDSPGPRIQVEGTIDLTPAQDLASSQWICTWPIKIGAISEGRARPKDDQISYQTGSKSATTASNISLQNTQSIQTANDRGKDLAGHHIIDLSGTETSAMTKESLQGSAPQIFDCAETPYSWLTELFRTEFRLISSNWGSSSMISTDQKDLMPPKELIMATIPSNYIPNETKCDCPFAASMVKLDRQEMAKREAGTLSKQLPVYLLYNHLFETLLNSRSSPPDPLPALGRET
ncbi:hypothetical protein HD553DRAFT_325748 [Filobasidium floriforme]|uniref:uncharacterized protein n=1 Tax=Filobasidium floriforme TaxID=5210 RepID=UPI001E8DA25F|nr:uncharacterized protein HD553DRAFT_325748 [Filobasidium floriforme]KAH8080770.1 hypothetical protein HD553DRAFT_325748 [Filobasidium floriforme]